MIQGKLLFRLCNADLVKEVITHCPTLRNIWNPNLKISSPKIVIINLQSAWDLGLNRNHGAVEKSIDPFALKLFWLGIGVRPTNVQHSAPHGGVFKLQIHAGVLRKANRIPQTINKHA